MTRAEALHKLLALGPLSRAEILKTTGWRADEAYEAMHDLVEDGIATFKNTNGAQQFMLVEQKERPRQFGKPRFTQAFIAQNQQPMISAHNIFSIDFYPKETK